MSSSIQFENIITFSTKSQDSDDINTLIAGNLTVSTTMGDDIIIPQTAPSQTSYIILQKGDEIVFKTCIKSAPVCPYNVSIIDQSGHLINNYASTRTTNNSGNVSITSEPARLINHIVMPEIPDLNTYLVISSYGGFESCVLATSKKFLVLKDLQDLQAKVDTNKIVLFITDKLFREILSLDIDLNCYFKDVFHPTHNQIIPYLVEYLFGKTVRASLPNFQGMLDFGDTNIISARICSKDNTINCGIRRHGKLQINTTSHSDSCKLIIVLKHKPVDTIVITEKTTSFSLELVPQYEKYDVPDSELKVEHFMILIKAIDFYEHIKALPEIKAPAFSFGPYTSDFADSVKPFIMAHEIQTIKYMFDSPLTIFSDIKSHNDLIEFIIDYGKGIHGDMFTQLYRFAYTNYNCSKMSESTYPTHPTQPTMLARAFSSAVKE
jgi:hypothetical protein